MSTGEDLANELLAMAAEDHRVRQELVRRGELESRGRPAYHPEMERVHRHNAARLANIIEEVGWPGRSRVGDQAAEAAWLIAQHAISDVSFQERCLDALSAAFRSGDASARHYAYLFDRVRMARGEKQRYGTQHVQAADGSTVIPWKIEDPAAVDELRRSVGLGPLAETTRELQERYLRESVSASGRAARPT